MVFTNAPPAMPLGEKLSLLLKKGERFLLAGQLTKKESRLIILRAHSKEGASSGGAKGYALAFAIEVKTGILTGSAYGNKVGFIYDNKRSLLMSAIRLSRLI